MKKLTSVLILAMVLAASASTFARDHERGHDRGHERGDRGPGHNGVVAMEMVSHMHRALKQLDLSNDQKTAIREEFKTMKEELKPLAEDMRDNRAALHQLLMAEDYDEAAVADVAEEQGAITADMIRLASGTINSVKGELTEDQLSQLAEMREERRERLKEHLGQLQKKLDRMESSD
jgi:protein CpxP